jgi:hypothetical protein
MRRKTFPRRLLAVFLILVSALAACTGFAAYFLLLISYFLLLAAGCLLLAACTGLLLSRTTTLDEATAFCEGRFAIAKPKLTSFREEYWEHSSHSKLTPGLIRVTRPQALPFFD